MDATFRKSLPGPQHLLAAIVLFLGLFIASYPYYRYFVDPDAVAYLTMAKAAAAGDHWRLVNALWSPLHPTLVAACIRFGVNDLLAAQLTNALACILIIVAVYRLFRRFAIERFVGVALLFALSFFLVYALYKQLFCDLWQIAFLLLYLLLITAKDFLQKPFKWMLCAAMMALAAYAKVYSFYFLLLHFPVALFLHRKIKGRHPFPLRQYVMVMILQLILIAPLVFLQHHKYGGWSLSKSGALNTSWMLAGHKTLRADIDALIPPPYPNSPYTWEDPWMSEGRLHKRFESFAMMKSGVAHSVQSSLQGVKASGEISPFLLAILAAALGIVLFKKGQQIFGANYKILIAAACILPIGYLLQHFEARYIWLLLPIGMILGARFLVLFQHWSQNTLAYRMAVVGLALSFITYPLYDLQKLFRGGEDIYNEAKALRSLGLNGSFTSNDNPSRSGALAYWCGSNYYTPAREALNAAALLKDIRRYGVKYYFAYSHPYDVAEPVLRDEAGRPFQEMSAGIIPELKVFLIQ